MAAMTMNLMLRAFTLHAPKNEGPAGLDNRPRAPSGDAGSHAGKGVGKAGAMATPENVERGRNRPRGKFVAFPKRQLSKRA
jgi:hypothetical protein